MKGMFEVHKKDHKVIYLKASTKSEMIKWVEILKGEHDDGARIRYTRQYIFYYIKIFD